MESPVSSAGRVEAQLEFTEADFRHALQSMPERRFGTAYVSVIGALALIGIGWVQGFDFAVWATVTFTVVLIVGLHLYSTRLQARRYFKEIEPERRRTVYVFTPTSLEITTKTSHVRQDYEGLKRYVLSPRTLLLYSTNAVAQVIPLRAFTPVDRERVIAWIQSQVKPSPKLPSALGRTVTVWFVLVVTCLAIWWLLRP